jgi:hypothetical protein
LPEQLALHAIEVLVALDEKLVRRVVVGSRHLSVRIGRGRAL